MTALDCTNSNRRETVYCRVGRPFDGLASVNQIRARSSDADLGGGKPGHCLSPYRQTKDGRACVAHLDDLGKDGGEGYGEEESEHAGVQVPEGAAPDEGDQGHQDQGDDARVDDAFACVSGG